MLKEYVNPKSKHANKRYFDFVDKFSKVCQLHASGQASADCLSEVCNLANPIKGMVPIHSENSADYHKLPIREELKDKIITENKKIDDTIIEIKRTTNRQTLHTRNHYAQAEKRQLHDDISLQLDKTKTD